MTSLNAEERQVLMTAVERDDIAVVQLLLSLGWPLAVEGSWGGTPLHWAAFGGSLEMVQWLVRDAGRCVRVGSSRRLLSAASH